MNPQAKPTSSERKLISSKPVFISAITIILLTIIAVWLWGVTIHRTVFGNALLSTNILSVTCFVSLSVSLFSGVKLKDTLGKITDKFEWRRLSELPETGEWHVGSGSEFGESFLEAVLCIAVGIVSFFLMLLLIWLFGNLFWAATLMAEATLYWIFFWAVGLALKKARKCKGRWILSFSYGLIYTACYSFLFTPSFWYRIFFITEIAF